MNGLDVMARWVLLTCNTTPIPEPVNIDASLCPPTERDGTLNPKYGFQEKFEHIPFSGTTAKMTYLKTREEVAAYNKSQKQKHSKSRQNRARLVKLRIVGGPNSDFLKRYGLTSSSHPMDWFTALMPMTPNDNKEDAVAANVKGNNTTKFAVSNWMAYSNTKAMLCNVGEPGSIYSGKFKPFSTKDIMQMIGIYILDGIAPSPQVEQKMQPQSKQWIQGNDFVVSSIGKGYQQKLQEFHHFFGTQDPLMTPPKKDECPNFKVDEFFRWLRFIWKQAWVLGKDFSIDEQTCEMQGKSEYKTCCGKFKRLGDGIQTDCIADDGYTWDFYFCNERFDHK